MTRWCIITGPRSGSVYVEQLLYFPMSSMESARMLGEFLAPNLDYSHKQYGLDANLNITAIDMDRPMDVNASSMEDFYQGRISMIGSSNTNQPLTMRVFCQSYIFPMRKYLNFFRILRDRNFRFISLRRDLLDRAISFYFMLNHGRIHRFEIDGHEFVTKNMSGDQPLSPVVVDVEKFMTLYRQVVDDDRIRQFATNMLRCPVVNYETAVQDLENLGIPTARRVDTKRTYDEDYRSMMLNYQEIIDVVAEERS